MDNSKKFWARSAKLYERFTTDWGKEQQAYEQIEAVICRFLQPQHNVLELAAGPGIMSGKIANFCGRLEVTDYSPEMIELAKKKSLPGNVHIAVADATALNYEDKSYDVVIIVNALHVISNPVKALNEIKRVLKDDGILLAPTYTRKGKEGSAKLKLMGCMGFKLYNDWDHEEYVKFIKSNGLQIIDNEIISGHDCPISFIGCKKENHSAR